MGEVILNKKEVLYGLVRKGGEGKLVGYSSTDNRVGDTLSFGEDNEWLVKDYKTALKAAYNNTPWFNADYETPINYYAGELDVVRVERVVTISNMVKENIHKIVLLDKGSKQYVTKSGGSLQVTGIADKAVFCAKDVGTDWAIIGSNVGISNVILSKEYFKEVS